VVSEISRRSTHFSGQSAARICTVDGRFVNDHAADSIRNLQYRKSKQKSNHEDPHPGDLAPGLRSYVDRGIIAEREEGGSP